MVEFFVVLGAFIGCVAVYDVFIQKTHTILHNFPIVGHFRYWLESIGPELRQYWVANDKEEKPFSRAERAWIYASSKNQNKNTGFGTSEVINQIGYPIIKHAAFPYTGIRKEFKDGDPIPCLKVMGQPRGRRHQFRPRSIVAISGMSYGSLGHRAIAALSQGAAAGSCLHNTGEGGISPHHLAGGADLIWQIGTGYFGARDENGRFAIDVLKENLAKADGRVKCIEIKLSQGAKPGKGGILPGKKVTREIAAIRGVPVGKACISPNSHAAFNSVPSMVAFIEDLAAETGLPVGIKSAVGELGFWRDLADHMRKTKAGPDFIAIDGAEGGTGAAPLTFADHVALPFVAGFSRVYRIFQTADLAREVVWVGSGQLGLPDRAMTALAIGCDMIALAREAMLAIGCIQAKRCHTDHCPAGIATQNWWLERGVNIDDKAKRFSRYLTSFRHELSTLGRAAGYPHPAMICGDDIEYCTGINQFETLEAVLGFRKDGMEGVDFGVPTPRA